MRKMVKNKKKLIWLITTIVLTVVFILFIWAVFDWHYFIAILAGPSVFVSTALTIVLIKAKKPVIRLASSIIKLFSNLFICILGLLAAGGFTGHPPKYGGVIGVATLILLILYFLLFILESIYDNK